jgi:hypothetical protein
VLESRRHIFPLVAQRHQHFIWPEYFNSEHNGGSFFGLEHSGFIRRDVEDAVVARRILHKGNVDTGWQVLVNVTEFMFKQRFLFFFGCFFHLA